MGFIVNIGSIAGKVTLPWMPLYSVSKYALGSLTEGLRMELRARERGAGTMIVCPGYVKTAFQQHVISGQPPASMVRGRGGFADRTARMRGSHPPLAWNATRVPSLRRCPDGRWCLHRAFFRACLKRASRR